MISIPKSAACSLLVRSGHQQPVPYSLIVVQSIAWRSGHDNAWCPPMFPCVDTSLGSKLVCIITKWSWVRRLQSNGWEEAQFHVSTTTHNDARVPWCYLEQCRVYQTGCFGYASASAPIWCWILCNGNIRNPMHVSEAVSLALLNAHCQSVPNTKWTGGW